VVLWAYRRCWWTLFRKPKKKKNQKKEEKGKEEKKGRKGRKRKIKGENFLGTSTVSIFNRQIKAKEVL